MTKRKNGTEPKLLSTDIFSDAFLNYARNCSQFREALDIITNNSFGKIWLIGGFVFRGITNKLHGVPVTADVDFDFIVESPKSDLNLPDDWKIRKSSYGNPKFVGPNYEIDLVPLTNIVSIKKRGLEPTLENFFTGTPMTVQSIAYDLANNRVIGDIGRRAIQTQTVSVNCPDMAFLSATLKGKSINRLVQEMAESLQFKTVL